jgi:hypothetical protein
MVEEGYEQQPIQSVHERTPRLLRGHPDDPDKEGVLDGVEEPTDDGSNRGDELIRPKRVGECLGSKYRLQPR